LFVVGPQVGHLQFHAMAAREIERTGIASSTSLPEPSAVHEEDVMIDVRSWLEEPTIRHFLLGFRQAAWPMVIRNTFLIGIHHQMEHDGSAEVLKADTGVATASSSSMAAAAVDPSVVEELITENKSSSLSNESLSTPTSTDSEAAQPTKHKLGLEAVAGSEAPAQEGHQRRQWLAPTSANADTATPGKAPAALPSSAAVEPQNAGPAYVQAASVDPSPSVSDATFLRPPPGLSTPRVSRPKPPGPESPWRLPDPSVDPMVGSAEVKAGRPLPHLAPGTPWPPTAASWPPPSPRAVLRVAEDFMNCWIAEVFAHSSKTESGGPGTPGLNNPEHSFALWPRAEATA